MWCKVTLITVLTLLISSNFVSAASNPCPFLDANPANSGATVTVDGTVVVVIPADARICSAFVRNSGSNPIRCQSGANSDPSSTVGFEMGPGHVVNLTYSAQQGLKCIKSSASATTVEVGVERN